MENIEMKTMGSSQVSERSGFTFFEKLILRRFHPISLLFDTVGLIWVTYFLWQNNWQYALGVVLAERLLASSIVWRIDFQAMATTTLGKLALLHLNPFNMGIQIVGTVVTIWALWDHSTAIILLGVSTLILGHTFGWHQVNPNFLLHKHSSILKYA